MAILLCYLPYLFIAFMSQTGFFPFVSDPWKIHPTTHSYKLDPWSCGWPKSDSQNSSPSSFSSDDFEFEGAEEQYEGYSKILEQIRFLISGTFFSTISKSILCVGVFPSRVGNLHSGTLEIFSLYHQSSLHLPADTFSAGPSCAKQRAHSPCSHSVACSFCLMEDDALIR